MWAAAVLVAGVLLGSGLASIYTLRQDFADTTEALATAREERGHLADDVDALRSQLIDLGQKPTVPAPKPGERGEPGGQGAQGQRGEPGRDGRDGITPACWFIESQCVGAAGPQGGIGPAGPSGPAGPAGPAGADGAPGPAGADGAPGPAGPQGPPPESFTFEWANRTYTCTDPERDGTFHCSDEEVPV